MSKNDSAELVKQIEDLAYIPRDREARRLKKAKSSISQAFALFERDGSRTCDVREMGTIVRALGLNPTESQLIAMVEEVEDIPPTGYIQYEKFEALMVKILLSGEFKGVCMARDTEDLIMQAFEVLDPNKTGVLDAETLKEMMVNMGERFGPEEINEFLNAASDPETGEIRYEDYAILLATD